jgi:hypothetical protein
LTAISRQPSKSISRVPVLVFGAAVLAFLDMEILTRHLIEIQVMPLGFTQAVVRPMLVTGVILCLTTLYIEGAMPRKPIDPARRRTSFKVLILCLLSLAVAVMVIGAFEFQMRTEHWEDSSGFTTTTYPVLDSWPDVLAFVLVIIAGITTLVLPLIAMIAPPYIMRFGWQGLWPFLKTLWRHRHAYGWRMLLLSPISLIAWPAKDFWMAGLWGQTDPSTKHLVEIGEVLRWNKWFGADGVALSAGIAAALFGMLLWWIGKAVGRALDTGEQSVAVDASIEVS